MEISKEEKKFKYPFKKLDNVFIESLPYYSLFILHTISYFSVYYYENPLIYYFLWWGIVPTLDIYSDFTTYNFSSEDNKRLKKANILFLIPLYITTIPDLIFNVYVLSECVNPEKTLIFKLILIFGFSEAQSYNNEIAHHLVHSCSYFDKTLAYLYLTKVFYGHYLFEHNKGHHLKTSTEEDPYYAEKNTTVYQSIYKSLKQEYISAWKIGYYNSESKKLIDNNNFRIHLVYVAFFIFYLSYYGMNSSISLYFY